MYNFEIGWLNLLSLAHSPQLYNFLMMNESKYGAFNLSRVVTRKQLSISVRPTTSRGPCLISSPSIQIVSSTALPWLTRCWRDWVNTSSWEQDPPWKDCVNGRMPEQMTLKSLSLSQVCQRITKFKIHFDLYHIYWFHDFTHIHVPTENKQDTITNIILTFPNFEST